MSGQVSVVKQVVPNNENHQVYKEHYANFVEMRERLFKLTDAQ